MWSYLECARARCDFLVIVGVTIYSFQQPCNIVWSFYFWLFFIPLFLLPFFLLLFSLPSSSSYSYIFGRFICASQLVFGYFKCLALFPPYIEIEIRKKASIGSAHFVEDGEKTKCLWSISCDWTTIMQGKYRRYENNSKTKKKKKLFQYQKNNTIRPATTIVEHAGELERDGKIKVQPNTQLTQWKNKNPKNTLDITHEWKER